jgi:hypothetical protein
MLAVSDHDCVVTPKISALFMVLFGVEQQE